MAGGERGTQLGNDRRDLGGRRQLFARGIGVDHATMLNESFSFPREGRYTISPMTTDHLPEPSAKASPKGRPRDVSRDRALMDATLTELQLHGESGLTTAAVGRQREDSPQTL